MVSLGYAVQPGKQSAPGRRAMQLPLRKCVMGRRFHILLLLLIWVRLMIIITCGQRRSTTAIRVMATSLFQTPKQGPALMRSMNGFALAMEGCSQVGISKPCTKVPVLAARQVFGRSRSSSITSGFRFHRKSVTFITDPVSDWISHLSQVIALTV